jgi:hypothetical protein
MLKQCSQASELFALIALEAASAVHIPCRSQRPEIELGKSAGDLYSLTLTYQTSWEHEDCNGLCSVSVQDPSATRTIRSQNSRVLFATVFSTSHSWRVPRKFINANAPVHKSFSLFCTDFLFLDSHFECLPCEP